LELPDMFGAGLMWNHNGKVKIGVDYSLQKWASVRALAYSVVNEEARYELTSGLYKDRHKLTLGGEICPNELGRNFFKRVHYRLGVYYATPYVKINGKDGPKEYSVSAGFGIPIMNRINNRSILNISAQWVHQGSKDFINENSFRINLSMTFNERWFAKWKME